MKRSIAVLITCFNRRSKTLASLEALFQQKLPANTELSVYLVDDSSTDGTSPAVRQSYPDVNLIQGDGNLFWNGGMRTAFAEALKSDHDYYLWLNDDTTLETGAIAKLLATHDRLLEQGEKLSVVLGATCDPDTGALTYGGMERRNSWHPLNFKLLPTSDQPQSCHTMNGNCVLIPKQVARVVGNLDPDFIHSSGDLDYGLRVRQQGGSLWLAPGFIGTCRFNSLEGNIWDNPDLSLWQRLKMVNQPKQLPMAEWKVFAKRHAGRYWFFYWLLPYVRLTWGALFGGKMSRTIND